MIRIYILICHLKISSLWEFNNKPTVLCSLFVLRSSRYRGFFIQDHISLPLILILLSLTLSRFTRSYCFCTCFELGRFWRGQTTFVGDHNSGHCSVHLASPWWINASFDEGIFVLLYFFFSLDLILYFSLCLVN